MPSSAIEFATFAATTCAAIAAGFAAYIAYRVGALSAYPDVVVYSTPDKNRPSIILLVIESRKLLDRTSIDASGDWHWFGSQSM